MNLFGEQDGRELHGPDVSGERDLDQQRSPRRSRGLSGCVPWLMAGLAVLGGGFYWGYQFRAAQKLSAGGRAQGAGTAGAPHHGLADQR